MNRYWVSGASGQLGGHVLRALSAADPHASIVALCRTPPPDSTAQVQHSSIDLADHAAVTRRVRLDRPTHIMHLGAMTAVADCFTNPNQATAANVDATRAMCAYAQEAGARILYSSTDMVFSGDHAPYAEADVARPLSHYGRTKLAAEAHVLACARGLVVRIPLLVGFAVAARNTTFAAQVTSLRNGDALKLFTDEYRTPLHLCDAARALVHLIRTQDVGCLHVGGPQRLSRLEIIEQAAGALGIEKPNLVPISRLSIPAPEPRPADLSLNSSLFLSQHPTFAPRRIAEALRNP